MFCKNTLGSEMQNIQEGAARALGNVLSELLSHYWN